MAVPTVSLVLLLLLVAGGAPAVDARRLSKIHTLRGTGGRRVQREPEPEPELEVPLAANQTEGGRDLTTACTVWGWGKVF
jgi:hypothetical protein